MVKWFMAGRPRKVLALVAIAAVVAASQMALAARNEALGQDAPAAAGLKKLDTSLKLAPSNVAFYSAMLRNREQFDIAAGSRAWEKIKAMPIYAMAQFAYAMQAMDENSPIGQFNKALSEPQTREWIDTLVDMASHEVFVYGDKGLVDLLELAQQVSNTMQYGPLLVQATGQAEGYSDEEIQQMLLISVMVENLDLINVPSTTMGFKLTDTDRAGTLLDELEVFISAELANDPAMEGRFKRTKIAGNDYLTLSLDGKMVPWDELPLDDMRELEIDEGDVDKLLARLQGLKMVIAVGIHDDYLMVSVGPSTKDLARLGRGKLLADREELAPLAKHADKRLTSIGYVSEAMAARLGNQKEDIDDLLEMVDELLPLAELDSAQEEKIRADAKELAEDVKSFIPKPGPMMGFTFLTEKGCESYQYNWTENLLLDGSKPLGLLKHLDGNPILAIVAREVNSPQQYDLLVKWAKKGYGYFEEYAVPEMEKRERKQYETAKELILPLLERIDKANRECFIPALADGQGGLVLDRKLTSRQFHESWPQTDEPLPMLEPAIVMGVSDAALFRKGLKEYGAVLDDIVALVREKNPGAIPEDYKIPEPKVEETTDGTLYSYWLPEEAGVDPQIAPSLGLSENVAVMTISKDHAARLLSSKPLAVGGVLTDTDRPLASASMFDWAGLIDAATPWVDFALEQMNSPGEKPMAEEDFDVQIDEEDAAPPANPINEAVVAQVKTVIEVLKVLRTITSETYVEGDAMVSHTLVEMKDVE